MVRKLIIALIILLILPAVALADVQVIDEMGFLTAEEIEELSETIRKVEAVYMMDLAVLITDKVPVDISDDLHIVRDYADSYYEDHQIGMRANSSGILYLLDMNNCVIWLSTCGDMIYYVNDSREDSILDAVYDYVIQADYSGSVNKFATMVNDYLWRGIEPGVYLYHETETDITAEKEGGDE